MKVIVSLALGFLLLSPLMATAAGQNGAPRPAPAAAAPLSQKLDLNTASTEELVDVPGIGPRMAQAIVDLRAKKGSFKSIDDLLEVSGIKEKKLAAIAVYLEVVTLPASASSTSTAPSR